MKAMILAAGEGTRLRPLTATVPKPMVPVVDQPLLAWTLHWLARYGVTEVGINLYHRPQSIPEYFGAEYAGIRLHYFFEDTLRGTSGGVLGAARLFHDAPFLVIYGDNLIDADLNCLVDFHRQHGGVATIALFRHPNPAAAGIVATEADGRVTRFVEKPPTDQIFADTANAGVYVMNPEVLEAIPDDGPSDFGRDVFPTLLAQGAALYGTLLGGYIHDTGTPDLYRQANWDALGGRLGRHFAETHTWIGPEAVVSPKASLQGRNILGCGVQIAEDVSLTDCILWEGARVGAGARLERAILGRGAAVEAGMALPPGTIQGAKGTLSE